MTRVKICGITNVRDARLAARLGADALGFNFVKKSLRWVQPERARAIIETLPPFITTVGIFANEEADEVMSICKVAGVAAAQFHGDESPASVHSVHGVKKIKAFRVKDRSQVEACRRYRVDAFLLDAYSPEMLGGTGERFNWELAVGAEEFGPIILAGGLDPENVMEAILQVQPYAVDVASGVESEPGKKDKEAMEQFIRQVREADDALGLK